MHPQAIIKPQKLLLSCPNCGHKQPEPPTAYSTVCKKCRQHFRVQDALHPAAAKSEAGAKDQNRKQVTCFKCGAELLVSPAAQSTMCKRCSSHVDLRDYHITSAVSKNFKTKGRFVLEENGFLLNTDSIVGEAVLKGRLLGKFVAERSLELYTSAEIKGSFQTGRLILPAGNRFRWTETLHMGDAEIAGELVAHVQATGIFHLKSSARFFGDVQARGLVIEEGAVFVGRSKVGPALGG